MNRNDKIKPGVINNVQSVSVSAWLFTLTDFMESFNDDDRLIKGRSYYRTGKILKMRIAPGLVVCTILGSSGRKYVSELNFRTKGIQQFNLSLKELLKGIKVSDSTELVETVKNMLYEDGGSVIGKQFPDIGEAKFKCSCPDPISPCKHIYAGIYKLIDEIKKDNGGLLTLSGYVENVLKYALKEQRDEDGVAINIENGDPTEDKYSSNHYVQTDTSLKYPEFFGKKIPEPDFILEHDEQRKIENPIGLDESPEFANFNTPLGRKLDPVYNKVGSAAWKLLREIYDHSKPKTGGSHR